MERKIYVVTGATSFIGAELVNKLSEIGHKVYAVCRPNSTRRYRLCASENISLIECELQNLEQLSKTILEKCDVFFHLAWHTTDKNNMLIQTENIRNTVEAVYVAKKIGCNTFVGAGSQAEYGLANVKLTEEIAEKPVSGYGMAKLCAGNMSRKVCAELGIRHIWPRIVSVYGTNDVESNLVKYLVTSLLAGENPKLSEGKQVWDFLHVEDCVNALYLLSEYGCDGEVYNVGSGDEITIREYAETIHKLTIHKCPELSKTLIEFGVKPQGKETPSFLSADITKLKTSTGFERKISFEEGITRIIDQLRGRT